MQFSAFFTTATILAIATLCNAECKGDRWKGGGQCAQGVKLFCHSDTPKCSNGITPSFDSDVTADNEKTCVGLVKNTGCVQQYCCD
ncbi:unnamed protein product [Diplocarpon coronariae]